MVINIGEYRDKIHERDASYPKSASSDRSGRTNDDGPDDDPPTAMEKAA